jgi:hypothetical protein
MTVSSLGRGHTWLDHWCIQCWNHSYQGWEPFSTWRENNPKLLHPLDVLEWLSKSNRPSLPQILVVNYSYYFVLNFSYVGEHPHLVAFVRHNKRESSEDKQTLFLLLGFDCVPKISSAENFILKFMYWWCVWRWIFGNVLALAEPIRVGLLAL